MAYMERLGLFNEGFVRPSQRFQVKAGGHELDPVNTSHGSGQTRYSKKNSHPTGAIHVGSCDVVVT